MVEEAGQNLNVDFLKFKIGKGFKDHIIGKVPESRLGVYKDRIYKETQEIINSGFVDYFLIVEDCLSWARRQGIYIGPGRGSVGGSLVAYVLDITKIDPIKYGLIWERFFNAGRTDSPPDIDMDIEDARRHEVISYLKDKYGDDCVCSITTFGRLALRSTIRDVARSLKLGGSTSESHKLAGEISSLFPKLSTGHDFAEVVAKSKDLQEYKNAYPELFQFSEQLQGLIRHAGIHACGIVISPEPILNTTPLKIQNDEVAIELELDRLESRKFMKFDFLGLSNLSIIKDAIELIREHSNPDFALETMPLDDMKTFQLIGSGNTLGVFQLESIGMRKYATHIKPRSIEDIALCISVYRPGALDSGAADRVVQVRSMGRTPSYLDPGLEPILKDSYSQLIYQESAMAIATKFAGFSLQEADTLRKAIGKKKPEIMKKLKAKFVEGCVANGHASDLGDKLFSEIEGFSNYGFNKSHAVGYAHISYWTAYLKTNYPTEYFTALLSHSDMEKIPEYISNAEEMGVSVLPPDINLSGKNFTMTSQNEIRRSLLMIKGIGESVVDSLIAARPFKSLQQFCYKRPVSQSVAEKLNKAGAFESLNISRGLVEEHLDKLYALSKGYKLSDIPGERANRMAKALAKYKYDVEKPGKNEIEVYIEEAESILEMSLDEASNSLDKKIVSAHKRISNWTPEAVEDKIRTYELYDVEDWNLRKVWEGELETCGQFVSSNPLNAPFVEKYIQELSVPLVDMSAMDDLEHESIVHCMFYVLELEEKRTVAKGKKMLNRFKILDKTGSQSIVFFSEKNKDLPFDPHNIVHARVKVYAPRGHSFRSYNIQSVVRVIK